MSQKAHSGTPRRDEKTNKAIILELTLDVVSLLLVKTESVDFTRLFG